MNNFCFVQAFFGGLFGAFVGFTFFWPVFNSIEIFFSIIGGATVLFFILAGFYGDSFWEYITNDKNWWLWWLLRF